MINNVSLTGYLTEDIGLKYTNNGTAVTNFTIAVQRTFTNAQGEKETDFIRCIAWRNTAETMSQFLNKGSRIGITGAIRTGSYEDKDGKRVYTTDVEVDNFVFLESKQEKQERDAGGQNQQQSQKSVNDNPFENVSANDNPFDQNNVNDIDESSLPF
ncbi:MAG: single-stranded DNA-binding protein [Alkalibacterium sp.]|nr:single-stranded DNA-binding protein [Alkalibacterium sp.]